MYYKYMRGVSNGKWKIWNKRSKWC
jgi:hypothetical protein